VEVVLHDLTHPGNAIVAISNNLSGRDVGDPTTELGLARIADPHFPEVLRNYPNRFPDGRPAKSTSIGIKNSAGEFMAAICLNMDISKLTAAATSLNQLSLTSPAEVKESLASPRMQKIRAMLEDYCARRNAAPHDLNHAQRREAVRWLADSGLMDLKHAQAIVAEILGVSRSTICAYLPQKEPSDE
jgi:predicted transcriptional regulator YheO